MLEHIKNYILEKGEEAEGKRRNFQSNEDALTGGLLYDLATPDWQYYGEKKWRIITVGPQRSGVLNETVTGSDGLIQIESFGPKDKLLESKCMVFQAKKTNNIDTSKRENLDDQIDDMHKFVRNTLKRENGSAVFIYDEQRGLSGINSQEFESSELRKGYKKKGLHQFIAEDFLDCKVGMIRLNYNIDNKIFSTVEFPVPITFTTNIEVRENNKPEHEKPTPTPKTYKAKKRKFQGKIWPIKVTRNLLKFKRHK